MSIENEAFRGKGINLSLRRSQLLAPLALLCAVSGCSTDGNSIDSYRVGSNIAIANLATVMDSAARYAATSGKEGYSMGNYNGPMAGRVGTSMRILERLDCSVFNLDGSNPMTVILGKTT